MNSFTIDLENGYLQDLTYEFMLNNISINNGIWKFLGYKIYSMEFSVISEFIQEPLRHHIIFYKNKVNVSKTFTYTDMPLELKKELKDLIEKIKYDHDFNKLLT